MYALNIPLSTDPAPNKQNMPAMITKAVGPGYPKHRLTPHRPTRCERCSQFVWPHFSWCELPCPRGGTSSACWQVCVFCGAMRCDVAPVFVAKTSFQPCVCAYPDGERGWRAAQADAAARAPRQLTQREYLALAR